MAKIPTPSSATDKHSAVFDQTGLLGMMWLLWVLTDFLGQTGFPGEFPGQTDLVSMIVGAEQCWGSLA
jgi:hypothetical protein